MSKISQRNRKIYTGGKFTVDYQFGLRIGITLEWGCRKQAGEYSLTQLDMDDKDSIVERQVERGDKIDDTARDIYRTAILVVSIIVAAAAINADLSNIFQTLLYDFGFALGINDSSLLTYMVGLVGIWAFLPAIVIIIIIGILFAIAFVLMSWLFFVPPYYAVRAQASAPISTEESTFHLIMKDIVIFFNTYVPDGYIPQRARIDVVDVLDRRIISPVYKEGEDFGDSDEIISHNKNVLSNKRENISRAKDGTQRFFVSIILFLVVVAIMLYV